MASLMENLIEVLNQESQEYEQLLELSTKKTPVIVAGNLDELAKITDEEQLVVSRVSRLERKRQEVFADIANVINRDVKTLLLPDLIEILAQRPSQDALRRGFLLAGRVRIVRIALSGEIHYHKRQRNPVFHLQQEVLYYDRRHHHL